MPAPFPYFPPRMCSFLIKIYFQIQIRLKNYRNWNGHEQWKANIPSNWRIHRVSTMNKLNRFMRFSKNRNGNCADEAMHISTNDHKLNAFSIFFSDAPMAHATCGHINLSKLNAMHDGEQSRTSASIMWFNLIYWAKLNNIVCAINVPCTPTMPHPEWKEIQ